MARTALGTDEVPEGLGLPCPQCGDRRTMVVFLRWVVCANNHATDVDDVPEDAK
jgi:hypothetical protein